MKYSAEVIVTLKNGVRDPQGAAVDTVLKRTRMEESAAVSVGKYFNLTISANDKTEAEEKLKRICEDVLSNPILEKYTIGRFEQL
jgi:phosphoribosylformylglycinamidine synthase PurS subunit